MVGNPEGRDQRTDGGGQMVNSGILEEWSSFNVPPRSRTRAIPLQKEGLAKRKYLLICVLIFASKNELILVRGEFLR